MPPRQKKTVKIPPEEDTELCSISDEENSKFEKIRRFRFVDENYQKWVYFFKNLFRCCCDPWVCLCVLWFVGVIPHVLFLIQRALVGRTMLQVLASMLGIFLLSFSWFILDIFIVAGYFVVPYIQKYDPHPPYHGPFIYSNFSEYLNGL